jgi:hypothetical protein
LKKAKADLEAGLQASCGDTIQSCAQQDASRFNNPAMNEAFYNATQT